MGVLEQLRKEADQKKSSEKLQLDQTLYQEHAYKAQILPKMQELFKYLKELVEHLNYLEVPVQVESYSLRFPNLGTLATLVRMMMPFSEISVSSSPSCTMRPSARSPVFWLILYVRTPLPPRPWVRNSSNNVQRP